MEIKVYDYQGNQRDMAYLKDKYGDFVIQPAAAGDGPSYEISTLREKVSTAATLVVRIIDENGASLGGYGWPGIGPTRQRTRTPDRWEACCPKFSPTAASRA